MVEGKIHISPLVPGWIRHSKLALNTFGIALALKTASAPKTYSFKFQVLNVPKKNHCCPR
jgi:hypothetical protein